MSLFLLVLNLMSVYIALRFVGAWFFKRMQIQKHARHIPVFDHRRFHFFGPYNLGVLFYVISISCLLMSDLFFSTHYFEKIWLNAGGFFLILFIEPSRKIVFWIGHQGVIRIRGILDWRDVEKVKLINDPAVAAANCRLIQISLKEHHTRLDGMIAEDQAKKLVQLLSDSATALECETG